MEDEPSTQEVIDLLEVVGAIEQSKSACCVMSLNVRSLLVHASDIAADPIMKMADILALSETGSPSEVKGFTCAAKAKRYYARAAGVAIHQNNSASTLALPHTIRQVCTSHDVELGRSDHYGDICAVEITIMGQRTILFCVFIEPNTTTKQKKFFMTRNLFEYQKENRPMIVTGNLNIDLTNQENIEFVDFMEKYLKLKLASDPSKPTNLSGSCVDMTFTRNIRVENKSYYSCFFFHRPILSVLQC